MDVIAIFLIIFVVHSIKRRNVKMRKIGGGPIHINSFKGIIGDLSKYTRMRHISTGIGYILA
jgi:hypothetical protein